MKKILVAIMAATMVAGSMASCGGNSGSTSSTSSGSSGSASSASKTSTDNTTSADDGGNVNPAGVMPIVKEPITLKFFAESDMTEDKLEDLKSNEFLKYIEETTNIKLDFTFLSYSPEGKQKMILAFASGDYPDGAMMSWNTMMSRADAIQYGSNEGILMPLNDYIDKYSVELKNIYSLRPEAEKSITAPDGNIYGIPRFTECGHCMSYPKMWLNYQWLDTLGLEEPQTTEDLYNVLKAFKTGDPNGNGKADEIALTGTVDFSGSAEYYLMNSFIDCPAFNQTTDPRMFLIWEDEQVKFMADRPEYKEGIEWIKKMYDEGLIDPANFTQNADSLKQQCRAGESIATVGAYTVDHMAMGIDNTNVPIADQYHALPPVAGPKGVRIQPYNSPTAQLAGFNFTIFDTCTNPEAAFRLADWFLGEEMTYNVHYGMKGYGWKEPADPNAKNIMGGKFVCDIVELPTTATDAEKKELAKYRLGFLAPSADILERRAGWSPAATDEILQTSYEARLEWETQRTTQYWPEVSLPSNLFMEQDMMTEFNELRLNINQHVVKNTSMFITGARPMSEWDSYCAELKKFNVDRYVEIYSQAYTK